MDRIKLAPRMEPRQTTLSYDPRTRCSVGACKGPVGTMVCGLGFCDQHLTAVLEHDPRRPAEHLHVRAKRMIRPELVSHLRIPCGIKVL